MRPLESRKSQEGLDIISEIWEVKIVENIGKIGNVAEIVEVGRGVWKI